MIINRLWVVVNDDTREVVYSSFYYSNARHVFDVLKLRFTVAGSSLFSFRLCRYDLNNSYSYAK